MKGKNRTTPAMMKKAWKPRIRVSPVAMRREKSERAVWAIRNPEPDQQNEGHDDGGAADEAHFGPDGGEDHVARQSGMYPA